MARRASPPSAEEAESAVAKHAPDDRRRSTTGRGLPHSAWEPGTSGNPAGRPKGVISYRDLLTAEDRARIADAAGCTPLQYLLSVMLDQESPQGVRLDAAKAAAPYMHRKMPIAVELPNAAPGLDVAKLLALPRADREALLSLLQRAGVQLPSIPTVVAEAKVEPGEPSAKVAAPDANGMPAVTVAGYPSKMAQVHARSAAAGKPLAPSYARATNAAPAEPGGTETRGQRIARLKREADAAAGKVPAKRGRPPKSKD